MSKNKAIIVKKIKKGGGGGHHGGAWKVAYADFVTAMMAFFLLMWLLNMTSDEKRARLSAYFKYFSIYESGGTSWMDKSSEIFGESGENSQKVFADKKQEAIDNSKSEALDSIEETLKNDIAEKLSDMKDQVLVDVVDEGVRIQMIDKEGSLMFELGKTSLTPKAKKVLKLISEDIKNLPNKVIIEGHTDSLPYSGSQYSNWELSTERASSARKELEATGLDPKRISRVAGYADTDPFIKDNKQDPRNRRISITLSASTKAVTKVSVINTAINSDEKQLRQASDELRHLIDNNQAPVNNKKPEIKTFEGSSADADNSKAGNSQSIIKQQEWPVISPVQKIDTVIPKSPVIKSRDYEAIIREGQAAAKNGKSNSKDKAQSDTGEKNNRTAPVIKSESKGPSVIKELSEPIIKKEKPF